jgi:glucokinase
MNLASENLLSKLAFSNSTGTATHWLIDGAALQAEFGINSVQVINDFAAVGYGVLDLKAGPYKLNPVDP